MNNWTEAPKLLKCVAQSYEEWQNLVCVTVSLNTGHQIINEKKQAFWHSCHSHLALFYFILYSLLEMPYSADPPSVE